MRRLKLSALLLACFASAASALDASSVASLRAQDERLLRIAEPIMAGNVDLCDRTMPDLGVTLQSTDQYPADAQPGFAAPVAFAVVLPGSAAAQAGIQRDDGLLAVDGKPIVKRPDLAENPLSDSAFAALVEHDPTQPLELDILHGGARRTLTIHVKQSCLAEVEIFDKSGNDVGSNGLVIHLDRGLVTRANDGQLAAIFAHELSHSILHHRERLEAAGVDKGIFSELGRNKRLNKRAEIEADRLSVYLLANAGIDPRVAPNLWRSPFGRVLSGGMMHSRAYPSAKARAQMLEAEIVSHHLAAGVRSYPADLLATRSETMR